MLESWHEPEETAERPDRRRLLAATGSALLGAAALPAQAASTSTGAIDALDAVPAGATVVLQDRRLELPADVLERLAGGDLRLLTLQADPVRMWRGEHAELLARRDTRLLGVTPWIEFVMIRGLAAESRRRVRYQRYDEASDAMVWLIA